MRNTTCVMELCTNNNNNNHHKKKYFFFQICDIVSSPTAHTHAYTKKKNNRMFRYGVSVCVCEQQCVCMSLAQRHYRFANSCIKSHVWTFSEHCFFFARFYHINAKFIPILMLLLCNLRQHNDSVKRAFHRIQIQCSRPKTSRKMISEFFFFWVDGENLPAMSNETCTITEFLHIKKRRRYNTHWRYYIYIEYKHLMAG